MANNTINAAHLHSESIQKLSMLLDNKMDQSDDALNTILANLNEINTREMSNTTNHANFNNEAHFVREFSTLFTNKQYDIEKTQYQNAEESRAQILLFTTVLALHQQVAFQHWTGDNTYTLQQALSNPRVDKWQKIFSLVA